MLYALVQAGKVATVVDVPPGTEFPGFDLVPAGTARAGDLYANGVFTTPSSPQIPVPLSVTRRQAKLALLGAGLLDAVELALAAIPDPAQRAAAQIEWADATTFERGSPLLGSLAAQIGLDAAQLDALFVAGGGL